MQGNPPQSEDETRSDPKKLMPDWPSTSPTPKSLKVASSSPSKLTKGFKPHNFARENLSPTLKTRLKQQESLVSPKITSTISATGVNRDPCADVIYLKQMLQASIERLQEMENDKHERYERWKQGNIFPSWHRSFTSF